MNSTHSTAIKDQKRKMSKRVMTSAIPNMTVAEVRKALGEVRKRATAQTPGKPFYITDMLTEKMTMQDFCLKFVCGHHDKRHNKGKRITTPTTAPGSQSRKRTRAKVEEDDDQDEEGDDDDDIDA